MTLTGYNIRIVRKGNEIKVYNATNDKHVVLTAEV